LFFIAKIVWFAQTSHVAECEQELRSFLPSEYGTFYWAISTAKNGYSGVVVIAKGPHHSEIDGVSASAASATPAAKEKKESKTKPITAFFKKSSDAEVLPASTSTPVAASAASSSSPAGSWGASGSPLKVRYGLTGKQSHADEGRAITLSFAAFHITFTYVPNAGEGLKRLDHRLQTWERDMLSHIEWLKTDGSSRVVIGGDLNCAHLDSDIWNNGAKHLVKQPGCTPQERQVILFACSSLVG
jgi:exonuclease III